MSDAADTSDDTQLKVILVRLSALGDIVHTWPLAELLHSSPQDLHLTWVVEEPFVDLVVGHPAVDNVVPVATRRWRKAYFAAQTRAEMSAARSKIRRLQADICIDPQGVMKSAVVTRLCGARRRVGLARPWRRELLPGLVYSETWPGSTSHPHVVSTNLEMARAVDVTPPAELPFPDGSWLREKWRGDSNHLPSTKPYICVAVAAGQPGKVLAPSVLAEVSNSLARPDRPVVVVWGPGERKQAQAVVANAGPCAELAPPTNLIELARIMDDADLVVGADTGPLHLAASLGTPCLSVFLATSWRRNQPLGRRSAIVSAVSDELLPQSGSARAKTIRSVSADEIVKSAEDLLSEVSQGDA